MEREKAAKFRLRARVQLIGLMMLCGLLVGCATVDRAQLADVASTGWALSHGASEGNPLLSGMSWPVAGVVKLAVTQAVKFTPEPFCTSATTSLTVFGFGAALWNLAVIVGGSTISGLSAIPLIVGLTYWRWDVWLSDAAETCVDPWHWQPIFSAEWGWSDR